MIYNDLIKIKNAYQARQVGVTLPYSKLTHEVVKTLGERGYLGEVKMIEGTSKKSLSSLSVELRYTQGVPHLSELRFLSKPGRRLYARQSQLHKVRQGFGDLIVSTPQGIMTASEARKRKIGGEIICEVF
ncbi:MAG: 30S ribosomal protein S8 [Candidatus Portnoybacteria bacterium]|nr:30S ribosomal protein S8 [Candidatus Portnoybacteria bacterium]